MESKWRMRIPIVVIVLGAITLLIMLVLLIQMFDSTNKKKDQLLSPAELSAWIVDWQWEDGWDDLEQVAEGLSSLQLFATYFDSQDQLYFTQEFENGLSAMMGRMEGNVQLAYYLTIVNDIWHDDGTAVQKDPDLISRLVATEESRNTHVQQLLDVVIAHDVAGLELDYERVRDTDWDGYVALIEALYMELAKLDKSLRIVLEPRAPIDQLALPEGPNYVMMAYNLYGYHSGPGPKADHAFLAQLASRMQHVPGDAVIALSAGGFDWTDDDLVKAVTEQQAAQLAASNNAKPVRDEASDSLSFQYVDDLAKNTKYGTRTARHLKSGRRRCWRRDSTGSPSGVLAN